MPRVQAASSDQNDLERLDRESEDGAIAIKKQQAAEDRAIELARANEILTRSFGTISEADLQGSIQAFDEDCAALLWS